ncbi:MAG: DinB family protein [Fibrobacteria bacterium]
MIEFKDSPFWKNYLEGGEGPADPMAAWNAHAEICATYFASTPEAKAGFRYAPEKWSVKQVLGHITDCNLIFLYRLTCIARGETQSLPGFDENAYMAHSRFDALTWRSLLETYRAVGQVVTGIVAGFDPAAWSRPGCANDTRITAEEMLRVLMGHERHHIRTLRDRYGLC